MTNFALIIGSAPNAIAARDWIKSDDISIICINNSYNIRPDWDYLLHPPGFPRDKRPVNVSDNQKVQGKKEYREAMRAFGGLELISGATMAFAAGYWALHYLKPKALLYIGCDNGLLAG